MYFYLDRSCSDRSLASKCLTSTRTCAGIYKAATLVQLIRRHHTVQTTFTLSGFRKRHLRTLRKHIFLTFPSINPNYFVPSSKHTAADEEHAANKTHYPHILAQCRIAISPSSKTNGTFVKTLFITHSSVLRAFISTALPIPVPAASTNLHFHSCKTY